MVQIRSFPYEADSNTPLSGKASTPLRSANIRYDDICSLLGCLSISTEQLQGGADQAGPGKLDPQMDLDSMTSPSNMTLKTEPPSDSTLAGATDSVEFYQRLLVATGNEIQNLLKRMRELETSGGAVQYPDLLSQIQNSQERAALSERLALLTHHQDALTEALYIEETMHYYDWYSYNTRPSHPSREAIQETVGVAVESYSTGIQVDGNI